MLSQRRSAWCTNKVEQRKRWFREQPCTHGAILLQARRRGLRSRSATPLNSGANSSRISLILNPPAADLIDSELPNLNICLFDDQLGWVHDPLYRIGVDDGSLVNVYYLYVDVFHSESIHCRNSANVGRRFRRRLPDLAMLNNGDAR